MKTKATSEMLIRRRLNILASIIEEYNLKVDIVLVPSKRNIADTLTRVPRAWVVKEKESLICCAATSEGADQVGILDAHREAGHPGI